MIAQTDWLSDLQKRLTNRLDIDALRSRKVAGILGDVPSTYAKSPSLWNAAFTALGVDATFVSFDIPQGNLSEAVKLLRAGDSFLGGSVTVPYKQAIIPFLDGIDPLAERIGAVNVVVRSAEGKLTGYNTDGLGGLRALTAPVLPQSKALLTDLSSKRVLLIGAGGAAQAVAVYLWSEMTNGSIILANRNRAAAESLAGRLNRVHSGKIEIITEEALGGAVGSADLIVNASLKGQSGARKLPDGRWTSFEAYSSLAAASPAAIECAGGKLDDFWPAWYQASSEDIRRNNDASLIACSKMARETVCYDIIYAPLESVFLRHARLSGHATLNGKEMNLIQAVEAFCRYVCGDLLTRQGMDGDVLHARVSEAMASQWGK